MTRTATTRNAPSTTISRASSILLSPSKRRRLDNDGSFKPTRDHSSIHDERPLQDEVKPSSTDILKWTFTKAAIAPCFVRDVFQMKESGTRDMEYFWLGRIPCRTVHIIGLVVGVQVWEKRTVYTIDDGTAVIDCAIAHAQMKPTSPTKPHNKATSPTKGPTKPGGPSFADYSLSARKAPAIPTNTILKRKSNEPPPPPKPVASVGQSARIVGRVVSRYDSRLVLVDEISRCASYNDEASHCVNVAELHRTSYYPPDAMPPFVPPLPPKPNASASQYPSSSRPSSPSKRGVTQEPSTPASIRSAAPSTTTSPGTSVGTASPTSTTGEEPKVPRLRHPSRLHTRDLTANTFRIYVKHYMDNAPPPARTRRGHHTRSESPSPTPRMSQRRTPEALTETDRTAVDSTPRPSRSFRLAVDRTPRASLGPSVESEDEDEDDLLEDDGQMYGYTLSHLRRVPELGLLARRVIKADSHRRAKEERKKAKPRESGSKPIPTAATPSSHKLGDSPTGPAVKRLFRQAIRTLFSEGDIVLWSGPVRPLPDPALEPTIPASCALWKANSSIASAMSSRSGISYEEWDDDEVLSDPTPGEEAYVPLTPAYFSRVLEGAIRAVMAETSKAGDATPKAKASRTGTSLIERLRAHEKTVGPPPGPTKDELLAWLRNSDERWERVGEWTVEEGLMWGKREGRLWCVGKGRWEVCG
ncbi:hypothetical protein C8Q80DRAFT_1139061 [Daedaleopsis nitida]|nr:hypothetical protein C8Q80DRAFT_1139061 [Daedaleopsis nitida]